MTGKAGGGGLLGTTLDIFYVIVCLITLIEGCKKKE